MRDSSSDSQEPALNNRHSAEQAGDFLRHHQSSKSQTVSMRKKQADQSKNKKHGNSSTSK